MSSLLASKIPSNDAPYGEEREQSHRNMLSAVAHDLKTPLASIIGSLEVFSVMHQKLPAEKQLELVRVALQEAHRLDNFMTNILDMAKLESNALKAKLDNTEIGALMRNSLSRQDYILKNVKIEMPVNKTIHAKTDAALLSRVVGLILDNAVKYGGNPPSIQINYEGDDKEIRVTIRDNGTGVAVEHQDNVFNKYVRLDRKDQKPVSGLGIGLPIARKLMELLNGKITISTHSEGGAVVTLLLPV